MRRYPAAASRKVTPPNCLGVSESHLFFTA
jgi:hypothetical protein